VTELSVKESKLETKDWTYARPDWPGAVLRVRHSLRDGPAMIGPPDVCTVVGIEVVVVVVVVVPDSLECNTGVSDAPARE
jgi:hypothetical protein